MPQPAQNNKSYHSELDFVHSLCYLEVPVLHHYKIDIKSHFKAMKISSNSVKQETVLISVYASRMQAYIVSVESLS